uniref:Uncharacterized protein n=1 Tax=Octopus bimaculoides TaxID=37653 RepID=A0A0L8H1S9_OCTBM
MKESSLDYAYSTIITKFTHFSLSTVISVLARYTLVDLIFFRKKRGVFGAGCLFWSFLTWLMSVTMEVSHY